MLIGRKIYYDIFTGNVLVDTGERQGNVVETTQEQDFKSFKELTERVPETVGVLKLEYGQNAQDFAKCNGYRVSLDSLKLEFSYPDPNNPEPQEPIYQKPLSEQMAELTNTVDVILTEIIPSLMP